MPLYYTVYGEMVRQYERAKTQRKVVRVAAYRQIEALNQDPFNTTTYQSNWGDPFGGTLHWRQVEDKYLSYQQVWYFEVVNNHYASAQSVGLTNPLLIAWELIPLSFVADWFVNVSDKLESLDVWLGKRFLTGTETKIQRSTTKRFATGFTPSSGYTGGLTDAGYASLHKVNMTRVVLTTAPTIPLRFQNGLNPKRLIDGIALLRNLFKK
jgi:hypothetical protein